MIAARDFVGAVVPIADLRDDEPAPPAIIDDEPEEAGETVNTQTGEVTQAEHEPVVSQQVTTEPEAEPQQAAPRTRKPMPVME